MLIYSIEIYKDYSDDILLMCPGRFREQKIAKVTLQDKRIFNEQDIVKIGDAINKHL